MPVFAYRALTGGGRARGGVIGAESARAAWQELRARGVYPTELRERAGASGWAGRRLGAEELAAATRQLATLAGAGVPVAEALAAVAEQSEHPALVRGLTVAGARLREGEPLADALAASPRVFPPLFRDLVRAGEASGALATVLARLDAALLGAPLAGPIVRKAAVARFARTLVTLLAGGLPLDVALGIAGAATGNCRLADAVASAREAVRQGEPLAPALRRAGVFPPLVVHLAAVGERAGALGPMLERAAAAYEREVETTISAATALVEPLLVLVMGGVVLALVAAVLLPLLDLNGLVR